MNIPSYVTFFIFIALIIPTIFVYAMLGALMQMSFYRAKIAEWLNLVEPSMDLSHMNYERLYSYLKPKTNRDETLSYKKYFALQFIVKMFKTNKTAAARFVESYNENTAIVIPSKLLLKFIKTTPNLEEDLPKIMSGYTQKQVQETRGLPQEWHSVLYQQS
jgi:DNA-directed RNA polymerase subunit F